MKKIFKISIFYLFLLFVVLIFQPKGYCQFTGVIVYPNIVEIDFTKSSQKFLSKSVFIENNSANPIRIRAYVENWTVDDTGGVIFLPETESRALNNYLKFNPREFDIQPGQKQMVRITAKLPDGVDGEFRSIIFFETISSKEQLLRPDSDKINVVVNFKTRYGVTLYAYKGNISRNADILDAKLQKINNFNYLAVGLNNVGNIHSNVEGELTLTSMDDKILATYKVPRYTIIPNNNQTMKILIPYKNLKAESVKAKLRLTYKNVEQKEEVIQSETILSAEQLKIQEKAQPDKPLTEPEIKPTKDNISKPLTKKENVNVN